MTLPDGGALGEKGGDAFLLVGGGAETAEDVGLGLESFGEGFGLAALDGFEDTGDGERGHGGDGVGERAGAGEEFGGGGDVVDEA